MNGLTSSEVEQLRLRLTQEYADLRREVTAELERSEQGRYLELAGRVHDRGDESVADLLADLELAALDRHVHRVRLVEAALAAIERGRYGLCRACGVQIGSGRLHAEPAAERCLECQTTAEQGRHAPTL
ncbi:MAG: TraR/DksA family transcriptional regulator [Immundisolibacter sp.]|uniref:TraR/DksA family transcriptional regulator n=1 Tax=Immundisolibacter sp. TaxID=1934948 RepID=UPI003EE27701